MLHYSLMEDSNSLGVWLGNTGMTILLIMAGVWAIRKFGMVFINRAIRKAIRADEYATKDDELRREATLIDITDAIIRIALYVLAVMVILSELGVDIGPMIAGAGVAGLAIGFGAQSLVKDFAAGMFIIMENQYRVGDVVEIAGVSGVVQEITIRTTVLRDLDGNEHHVPNGSIGVSTNMTMHYANINLNIGVAYDTDIDKAAKVINDVGKELGKDKELSEHIEEAPYFVRVDNFGASEVELKILGKVKPGQQWAVAGEFRKRLKEAFDKEGIEIPFPQMDVHQKK